MSFLQEARSLAKARKLGVLTPTLYAVDPAASTLTLERVEGRSLKDLLLAETLTHEGEFIGGVMADLENYGDLRRPASSNLVAAVPL